MTQTTRKAADGRMSARAPYLRTGLAMGIALAFMPLAQAAAVDAVAAKALFKGNDCTNCHAPEKTKKGPSLKKIAQKYAGKADGEAKVMNNMVAALKVKLEDGTEEDHKVIDTKDKAQMKNLAQWILGH